MRNRFATCTGALGMALSFAAACATSTTPAAKTATAPTPPTSGDETPKPTLAAREDLPPEAHEVLAARMMRHGDQMSAMMLAVVLLDYEVVRLLTQRMLQEPTLGRPAAGDAHSLNALLPASFFVHQDALRTATVGLAEAAAQSDDQKLIAAFNEVSKTCVGCHSAYLHEALVQEDEIPLPCELTGTCDEGHEPEEGGAHEHEL